MLELNEITWMERTEALEDLLKQETASSSIPAGLEASVCRIRSSSTDAVIKIWNKGSDADVGFQHRLLSELRCRGISVSDSYGWGFNASNHKVLVTSYNGSPISTLPRDRVHLLADILLELHQMPLEQLDPSLHKKYDFTRYFFPRLNEHQDIRDELIRLVSIADPKQNTFIHGDFNLGNVLDHEGKYTVIDWTNAQCGDARYDMAWASFLIHIYVGSDWASVFKNAYLAKSIYDTESVLPFEALACLRWLLLCRFADIPKSDKTVEAVNTFISDHPYLSQAQGLQLTVIS